jgi:uncharacterized protein YdaU (DUF1376 family)
MPFYVGDYLGDTAGFSAEEHGAYLLLLFSMWAQGGELPDDQERLRRIACVDKDAWPGVWKTISTKLIRQEDAGTVTQDRLQREYQAARERRLAASAAGRAGAVARWQAHGDRIAPANGNPSAPANGAAKPSPVRTQSGGNAPHPDPDPYPDPDPHPDPEGGGGSSQHRTALPQPPPAVLVLERFKLAWARKYNGLTYGGGMPAARALGALDDALAGLPTGERKSALAAADAIVAAFLADTDPKVVKERHPFAWFVTRFDALRVEVLATAPPPSERRRKIPTLPKGEPMPEALRQEIAARRAAAGKAKDA